MQSRKTTLLLIVSERRIDLYCAEAQRLQCIDLVLHQTDERRQHENSPVENAGGELKSQGLARTSGHHGDAVTAGEYRVDNFALSGPEVFEAKSVSKHGKRVESGHGYWR